jgi:hypothetical protein
MMGAPVAPIVPKIAPIPIIESKSANVLLFGICAFAIGFLVGSAVSTITEQIKENKAKKQPMSSKQIEHYIKKYNHESHTI